MLKKPLKKNEKIIAKTPSNLVRRYANKIRRKKHMRGGMSDELISKIKDFLKKYAEKTKELKYKLLDELCEYTSKAGDDEAYAKRVTTLRKINDEFTSKPKLYSYNINDEFLRYDKNIKKLVYALKLVRSISSCLKITDMKILENNELESFTFDLTYISKELLNSYTKDIFINEYEKIKLTRSNIKSPPPQRPPSPRPPPQRQPQEEQLPEAAFKLLQDIVSEKEELNQYPSTIGGNPPRYKSTGKAVYILYKKKKYKRTIYVKDKRKTKYCKINNEYILLSKLKIIE
jgi:hypothetical protein